MSRLLATNYFVDCADENNARQLIDWPSTRGYHSFESSSDSLSDMEGVAMKRTEHGTYIVGFLLIGAMGCGIITTPPPKQDDTVSCSCNCDDACTSDQFVYNELADGTESVMCKQADADFPNPNAASVKLDLRTCVRAGASADTIAAACRNRCDQRSTIDTISPYTNRRVNVSGANSIIMATRVCQGFTTSTTVSTKSCNVSGSGSFSQTAALTVAGGSTDTSVQTTSQSTATATVPNESEGFDTVTIPPPTGQVRFSGGDCVGRSCPINIQLVSLDVPAFSGAGMSFGKTSVQNTRTLVGNKDDLERVSIPITTTDIEGTTTVDGVVTNGLLAADQIIKGQYSPTTGVLVLNGAFSDPASGSRFDMQLLSSPIARPPTPSGGPDQNAACTTSGKATVSLSAAGSVDPDGDAMTFAWSELGNVLARGTNATLSLGGGRHDIILTATDSTGRAAQDLVIVTVSDTVAPVFTFVPPTVVVETSGPVNIGQARATDSCSSTATVTNNAPASFPIGRTVVTWTATDASGNKATATQLVYVLPPIAASCPPGSNIILGTSNNDTLIGTSGPDCIIGFGGQDRIEGRGGNDTLLGGEGDDVILGGDGDDIIVGGGGQDTVSGEAGNDLVAGAGGDDTMSGGDGTDTLVGGDGQDRMNGDAANDTLVGNAGDDTMNGGAGTDRCVADQDHDTLIACELP
jgi:Ca2+-binding RTX toxin-like protein